MKEYTVTVHGRALKVVQHDDGTFDVPEKGAMPEGGSALKPAHEPIVMARKPLVGTLGKNVLTFGTGALNIGATRIPSSPEDQATIANMGGYGKAGYQRKRTDETFMQGTPEATAADPSTGRWPSNVLLSDPELFDEPNPAVIGSGATTTSGSRTGEYDGSGAWTGPFGPVARDIEGDSGGYSRFFLVPKAPVQERMVDGQRGTHPTQKPIDLMRHLLRLVTPPGGVALDPFGGSGTTAVAASLEGMRCILIEREAEYIEQARSRLIATPMGLGLDVGAPVRKRALPTDQKLAELAKTYPGRIFPNQKTTDEEPAA